MKGKVKKYLILALLMLAICAYISSIAVQLYKYSQARLRHGLTTKLEMRLKYNPVDALPYLATNDGMTIFLVVSGFILLIIITTKLNNQNKVDKHGVEYSAKGTHGTSGWMGNERYGIFNIRPIHQNEGIILGREGCNIVSLSLDTCYNKHMAVFGATGSGKSRTFVLNNILNLSRTGQSMIMTDPKGELYRETAEYLRNIGYNVKILNLADPIHSDRWNPLSEVSDDLSAHTLAQTVIVNTNFSGKPTGDLFWDRAEMNLLKALCLYVVFELPGKERHMGNLYNILASGSGDIIDNLFNGLPMDHPAKHPYNIYKQANDNVRTGVIIGLGTRLQVFQNDIIKKMTRESDINLEEPGKSKCAYFCVISDVDMTFDYLASLFFSFLFMKLVKYSDRKGAVCNPQVYFLLDEFPNIGQIPDFTKKISTVRSRGIHLSVIFQNLAQLENRYPNKQFEEIIGNCDTKLILGCTDYTTARFISEIIGKTTIVGKSFRKELGLEKIFDYGSLTDSEHARYLLNPDEVLRFDSDKSIVIIRGQKPLQVYKTDYTEHFLARKLRPSPYSAYNPEWVLSQNGAVQVNKSNMKIIGQDKAKIRDEDVKALLSEEFKKIKPDDKKGEGKFRRTSKLDF